VNEADEQYNVELLRRVAQGDNVAFAALYDRLSPILYSMALRMMNDAGEAEDVLQDGFIYIWRRASAFEPGRSNSFAWAVMIVRNKAIDRLRVRQRGERLQERVTSSRELFSDRDDLSALEPFLRERKTQVQSALSDVSPEQRQALQLSFFFRVNARADCGTTRCPGRDDQSPHPERSPAARSSISTGHMIDEAKQQVAIDYVLGELPTPKALP
jgi:RNA polymerase sigma-70 factor, ECF subfamily